MKFSVIMPAFIFLLIRFKTCNSKRNCDIYDQSSRAKMNLTIFTFDKLEI